MSDGRHYRGFFKDFMRDGPGKIFEQILTEAIFENDKDLAVSGCL